MWWFWDLNFLEFQIVIYVFGWVLFHNQILGWEKSPILITWIDYLLHESHGVVGLVVQDL